MHRAIKDEKAAQGISENDGILYNMGSRFGWPFCETLKHLGIDPLCWTGDKKFSKELKNLGAGRTAWQANTLPASAGIP